MSTDVTFNLAILLLDGALLWVLGRFRSPRAAIWGATGLVCAIGLLSSLDSGFGVLRLLAWGLFLHVPLCAAGATLLLWRRHRALATFGGLTATSLVAVYVLAFHVEPYRLEVVRHRIPARGLERPLRIAVLADLQTDRAALGEHERRALAATFAAGIDLVLLPGDFVQEGDPDRRRSVYRELNAMFRELGPLPALGVHAVGGNSDSADWPELFAGLAVNVIERSRSLDVGPLRLTGLDADDSANTALPVAPTERFHIAFGHYPDFSLSPRVHADLLVAGHTHGGQVQLPGLGALMTLSRVPRAWANGAIDLGAGRWLVVSRGVGMERGRAPRLRFLCRPEVTVIELVPITGAAPSGQGA